ncbi:MAG: DUF86 domain-containing protein [Thermoplasmatales archaeon]|nr:DUF86 domain-containing protein [Thermoplasmatales archaeon]
MRNDIIKTKIKEMEESLKLVEKYLPGSFKEFSNLELVKDGIYKRLEFCIENMFDICAVINTDLELGIPESDENIVDNLIRNKVINDRLGEKLKSMRGFRNILVHRYGRINDELAFEIMSEHLQDFYDFIEKIENFIQQK